MPVEVFFQNPASGSNLLEQLLLACDGATSGGALFAWANHAGSSVLLDDPAFDAFLAEGTFELVVGLDSITDTRAVRLLEERSRRRPNLHVRAFCHDEPTLFHPKLAWFREASGALRLLVGSGNLTLGGLKNNWEAFAVARLEPGAAPTALHQIDAWLKAKQASLRELDDAEVRARAARNTGREQDLRRVGTAPPAAPPPVPDNLDVLVAEIPKGRTSFKQADVGRAAYESFFGAEPGTQSIIVLQHVDDDGSLGRAESRRIFMVKSQNYRVELGAAQGIGYPPEEAGRPFGVFVRVLPGTFVYRLVLPGDATYAALLSFARRRTAASHRPDRMRRLTTTVAELRREWPQSPLWRASLEDL